MDFKVPKDLFKYIGYTSVPEEQSTKTKSSHSDILDNRNQIRATSHPILCFVQPFKAEIPHKQQTHDHQPEHVNPRRHLSRL